MSIKTRPVSLQFSLPVIDTKKIVFNIIKPFKTSISFLNFTFSKMTSNFKNNVLPSLVSKISLSKKNSNPAFSVADFSPTPPSRTAPFQLKRLNIFKFAKKKEEVSDISSQLQSRKFRNISKFSLKKVGKYALLGLIALIVVAGGARIIGSVNTPESARVEILGAKASQDINKEFLFPLTNSEGEEVSNLKYVIQAVELRDEIVVKGQRATAIEGRTFLILTLKITNEHSQAIEMTTRDYIRLSVNGNEDEWLAPDIHNDPVEIQAISTKNTRVGFPLNDADNNLVLRVGEINGEKEKISLELN